jgi:hypothetical protein
MAANPRIKLRLRIRPKEVTPTRTPAPPSPPPPAPRTAPKSTFFRLAWLLLVGALAAFVLLVQPWDWFETTSGGGLSFPGRILVVHGMSEVLSLRADGTGERVITGTRVTDAILSPDGRHLAWIMGSSRPRIFIRDLQTGSDTEILYSDSERGFPRPVLGGFSAGGAELLISEGYASQSVYVVDVQTGQVSAFTCIGVTQWHRFAWTSSGVAYGAAEYQDSLLFDPAKGNCTTIRGEDFRWDAIAEISGLGLVGIRAGTLYRVDQTLTPMSAIAELPQLGSASPLIVSSIDGRYAAIGGYGSDLYLLDVSDTAMTRLNFTSTIPAGLLLDETAVAVTSGGIDPGALLSFEVPPVTGLSFHVGRETPRGVSGFLAPISWLEGTVHLINNLQTAESARVSAICDPNPGTGTGQRSISVLSFSGRVHLTPGENALNLLDLSPSNFGYFDDFRESQPHASSLPCTFIVSLLDYAYEGDRENVYGDYEVRTSEFPASLVIHSD